jgi:hypothetical protein
VKLRGQSRNDRPTEAFKNPRFSQWSVIFPDEVVQMFQRRGPGDLASPSQVSSLTNRSFERLVEFGEPGGLFTAGHLLNPV